jgi:cell wall-associated NlpC family hydrolase
MWEIRVTRSVDRQIRWVHHGRDPRTGLDCVGLVIWVYRQCGIDLSDLDLPYGVRECTRARSQATLQRRLEKRFAPVTGDLAEGDVLLLRGEAHLAIVVKGGVWYMNAEGLNRLSQAAALPLIRRAYRYKETHVG